LPCKNGQAKLEKKEKKKKKQKEDGINKYL
jgi:hypothetical protein